jgi:peptide/nickel transport system permease protein
MFTYIIRRLLYGLLIMLFASMGLLCTLAVTIIGIIIGSIAGYFGGWPDRLLMGLVDLVLSLPYLQVLLVLSFLFGPYYWVMFMIITLLGWAGTARLVRGVFLSLRNYDYVEATHALGRATPASSSATCYPTPSLRLSWRLP